MVAAAGYAPTTADPMPTTVGRVEALSPRSEAVAAFFGPQGRATGGGRPSINGRAPVATAREYRVQRRAVEHHLADESEPQQDQYG